MNNRIRGKSTFHPLPAASTHSSSSTSSGSARLSINTELKLAPATIPENEFPKISKENKEKLTKNTHIQSMWGSLGTEKVRKELINYKGKKIKQIKHLVSNI